MGFGSFFKSIANPLNVINPVGQTVKAIKGGDTTQYNARLVGENTFDPAGAAARTGFGNDARNGRSFIDPSGQLLQAPRDPRATYQRQPYVSHLSPEAQALKDQIMARRMARANQGMNPQAAGSGFAGAINNAVQRAIPVAPTAPTMRISDPRTPPMVMDAGGYGLGEGYADGGRVKKRAAPKAKSVKTDAVFMNKAFARKPNGKPC